MIDPVTAMSVAVNAFGTIKRMVSAGKEVEDTLSQIGRFYGAVSDLSEHRRRADNPPCLRRSLLPSLSMKRLWRHTPEPSVLSRWNGNSGNFA